MPESHVIAGLKAKRARLAGEIIQAQETVARRTKELLAIDAVIRLFSPDCDPEMIAPIRPTSRGLLFQYREVTRLCMDIMRGGGKPVTLDMVVSQIMLLKGFPDDTALRRRVYERVHSTLARMSVRGRVRRILEEPDQWWELTQN